MNTNYFLSHLSKQCLFFFVFMLILFFNMTAVALSSEELVTKSKQPHVVIIGQFSKMIKLTNASASYTDDFVPQVNVKNFKVILHFKDLNLPDNKESKNLKIQELFKVYNQISVSIYDMTDKKLISTGRLDSNILASTNSNLIFISNNITLLKYRSYQITIDNIPPQTTLDPAYNTFMLVVGDEMSPLQQFFLHLLYRG